MLGFETPLRASTYFRLTSASPATGLCFVGNFRPSVTPEQKNTRTYHYRDGCRLANLTIVSCPRNFVFRCCCRPTSGSAAIPPCTLVHLGRRMSSRQNWKEIGERGVLTHLRACLRFATCLHRQLLLREGGFRMNQTTDKLMDHSNTIAILWMLICNLNFT